MPLQRRNLYSWHYGTSTRTRASRANGLLIASTDWFSDKTGLHNRNNISDAVLELEVRGLVRVKRGRGGNGVSYVNMFQLTAFPDCLGNKPTADYERLGLPQSQSMANDPATIAQDERDIAARFNARIRAQIEIVRYTRNQATNAKRKLEPATDDDRYSDHATGSETSS